MLRISFILCLVALSQANTVNEEDSIYTYLPDCEVIKAAQLDNRAHIEKIIAQSGNIDCQNKYGKTALMISAAQSYEALCVFIEHGADVNLVDKYGHTAIMHALNPKSIESIKKLIAAGADLEIRDYANETVLAKACRFTKTQREIEIISALLDGGANPNVADSFGITILMQATSSADVIEALVSHGADINAADKKKKTVLMYLSEYASAKVVEKFLSYSPLLNQRNKEGKTEIMFAASNPNVAVLDVLKDKVEIDAVDKRGRNALMYAVSENNIAAIDWLIANGQDINSVERDGRNVFFAIAEQEYAEAYKYRKMVEYLVKLGVDINQKDDNGKSPLTIAFEYNQEIAELFISSGAILGKAEHSGRQRKLNELILDDGDIDAINEMLDAGADVNGEDETGMTPFIAAAIAGREIDVFIELLKRGVDINSVDRQGRSLLMYLSAGCSDTDLLSAVIVKVKNINHQDANGSTALMFSTLSGDSQGFKILINNGADGKIKDSAGKGFMDYLAMNPNEKVVTEILDFAQSKSIITADAFKSFTEARIALLQEFSKPQADNTNAFDIKPIIKQLDDINQQDDEGVTLLMEMCEQAKDSKTIQEIIDAGADLEIKDNDGWTAFGYAVNYAPFDTVQLLLEKGADANVKYDRNPLMTAARNPDYRVFEYVYAQDKSVDVNAKSADGWTAFMFACRNPNPAAAKKLIELGADVKTKSNNGIDALQIAIENDNLEIVKILVQSGVDLVSKRAPYYGSPLWTAAMYGSGMEIVDVIIDAISCLENPEQLIKESLAQLMGSTQISEDDPVVRRLTERAKDHGVVSNEMYTESLFAIVSYTDNLEKVEQLLAMGADPRAANEGGSTMLMYAARNGHLPVVKAILKGAKDIDAYIVWSGDEKVTALHYAVSKNENIKVAKAIIEAGADIKNKQLYGNLANCALQNRNKDILKLLEGYGLTPVVSGKDLVLFADNTNLKKVVELLGEYEFSQEDLNKALLAVSRSSSTGFAQDGTNTKFEIIKELVAKGAQAGIKNEHGETPILNMCRTSAGTVEVIQFLIDNGADVNSATNRDFLTPLLFALQGDRRDVVKFLLDAGAVVNNPKENILLYAIQKGRLDYFKMFIEAGAIAGSSNSFLLLTRVLRDSNEHKKEMFELLLSVGADINAVSADGTSVVSGICESECKADTLQLLLDKRPNLEVRDFFKNTTLMSVCRFANRPETMRQLIDAGADINATDNSGNTILMTVCQRAKTPEVVEILLKAGADTTLKNRMGRDAAYYLSNNRYFKDHNLIPQ